MKYVLVTQSSGGRAVGPFDTKDEADAYNAQIRQGMNVGWVYRVVELYEPTK